MELAAVENMDKSTEVAGIPNTEVALLGTRYTAVEDIVNRAEIARTKGATPAVELTCN